MFTELLRVSLFTGVLILILLLFFAGLGKRYTSGLKYWIWLLLALRLLIPATITLPETVSETVPAAKVLAVTQSEFRQEVTRITAFASEQAEPAATPNIQQTIPASAAEESSEPSEPQKQPVDYLAVAGWVHLAGIVLFLGYYALAHFTLHRHLRRWGKTAKNRELKALVARAKKNAGVKGPMRLMILKDIGSPMVMGIWRPTLILPQEEWDATELYYVLRHEMTHLKRRDAAYKAVLLLANAVHWFNPLVWLMRIRAYQDLEISCDMAVVSGATQSVKISYCETIMATAQRSTMGTFSVANTFGSTKKSIMERFREIFSVAKRKRGTAVLAVVLILAVLGGCTVSLAASTLPEVDLTPETMEAEDMAEVPTSSMETEVSSVSGEQQSTEIDEAQSITLDHVNPYWHITIPLYAQEWLRVDDETKWLSCVKDGEEMFSILMRDADDLWMDYGWLDEGESHTWPMEALSGWDYLLGRNSIVDSVYYVIRLTGASDFPESQQLIQDILDLNLDIVPNPCLIAEPYYRAEGAEEAIELYQHMSDTEALTEEILGIIKSGTNEAGASDEILYAFAEFMAKRWEEYVDVLGEEYVYSTETGEDGRISLKIMRDPPVEGEVYYTHLHYVNNQVVYGTTYGYKAPYEPPDAEEASSLLSEAKAKLEGANMDGISQTVIDELAQWIVDSIMFMDHYGDWEWNLAEEDNGVVLSCTSDVTEKGVRSFCQLAYKDGEISSSSGASADKPAAEAGLGRCARNVVKTEEPEDLPDYMVLEHELLEDGLGINYFMNDIDVLAMLGAPVQWYPDEGSGYETARYDTTCYSFALCSQCQTYHLYGHSVEEDAGVALPLGLEMGIHVDEVLSAIGAEAGISPSQFDLYNYEDRYFARYTPVGDTGLVTIQIWAGELYWDIGFDKNNMIYRSQVTYRD